MISEEIKTAVFDALYEYTDRYKDEQVLLYPKALKIGFMQQYGLSEAQVLTLTQEFNELYGDAQFYADPMDIIKDFPEHEAYILTCVFGPDYQLLSEEEKASILTEKRKL